MKSKKEINAALVTHTINRKMLTTGKQLLKETADKLGWTEEYTKGYMEGVEWAYKWVLEMTTNADDKSR